MNLYDIMQDEYADSSEKRTTMPITDINKINKMAGILHAQKHGERNYLLFIIGVNTGMKISDYSVMTVGQFREICKQGYIEFNSTEENKGIRLDISDNLKEAITKYIDGREDSEYMFPSNKGGTPIKRQTIWLILNNAAIEAGIEESLGAHSLRKTFGYWHYKQNHNAKMLMEILQQNSEEATLKYIGISTENMKDNMSLDIV